MVMKRPMVAFLTQLLLAIRSRFTRRARLEAENLILRQQLVVLRRNLETRETGTSIACCWYGCIDCTRRSWTRSSLSSRRPYSAGTDGVSAHTGAGSPATSA